jgi:predicted SAM-dependent methyltransferase
MKELKLHLGCGRKKIHGFVNVDACAEVEPDVIDDCSTLGSFRPNSAELIYASHIIEHFKRTDLPKVLKRWNELLVRGGVLRIATPDLRAICEAYLYSGDAGKFQNLLCGDQKDEWNNHYILFDEALLTKYLTEAGFVSIKRYDWRTTEHSFIDDYSQCYYPKISYETRRMAGEIEGKLVSLNIEAIK